MTKHKLTLEQYNELKKFLEFFSNRFFFSKNATPENKLLAELAKIERTAPGRAAVGLAMMINDCVEMASGWGLQKVLAIDAELKSSGIVTLSDLRRKYSRQYATVVKRGHINNDEEYYLIKGVLDGGALEIPNPEKTTLNNILDDYERSAHMRSENE